MSGSEGITTRCPTCGETAAAPKRNAHFPFCAERCKLVDLGRWMAGHYALDPASGRLDVIDPDQAEEIDPEGDGAGSA